MRQWIKSRVVSGMSYLELCVKTEEEIVRRGGDPAFPCGIGVNHVSAHYSPQADDSTVIRDEDVVKIDFGVHIDGYIADTAVTTTFNPRYVALLEATERALRAALDMARKDRRVGEIGRAIFTEAARDGFRTIANLSGHTVEQYVVHAGKSIPNLYVANLPVLKKGEVFAIEPFLTPGDASGYVVDAPQETIFSVTGRRRTGRKDADELLEEIWSRRKTLPFTPRWFGERYGMEKLKNLLTELKNRRLVRGYPTLVEASSRPVAQFEHTVALEDDGLTILT